MTYVIREIPSWSLEPNTYEAKEKRVEVDDMA
jgi:hypothetical protein